MADDPSEKSMEDRLAEIERRIEGVAPQLSALPESVRRNIAAGENAIRAIRRHRFMTQKDLSDAAGLGANHISRIENGAQFNMRTARRLAAALGVRIDDIS